MEGCADIVTCQGRYDIRDVTTELLAFGTWDLVDDILETGSGTGGFGVRQ